MSERELLAWLRRAARGLGGERIGDDAALLPRGGPWAVTVDSQIEGVHFPAGLDPAAVAKRLAAVNLSDLAAMGARPCYALLALAAPPGFEHRRFFRSLLRECKRFGFGLVGGDLARASVMTATLTLIGEPARAAARPPASGRRRDPFVHRDSARPGDALWCGGTLGESAAGRLLLERGARWGRGKAELPAGFPAAPRLRTAARRAISRHLEPAPQLALGAWLASRRRAAAIDVSDGLALDLARLCAGSSAGARLDLAALPASPRLAELAAWLGASQRELVLGGGEDYVLLFALGPREAPPASLRCRRIGEITRRKTLTMIDQGREAALPILGWDHLS